MSVAGDHDTTADKSDLKEAYLGKDIIRLGTQYMLASKYTSFVAVDSTTQVLPLAPSSVGNPGGFASGSVRAMSTYCALSMRHSVSHVRMRSIGSCPMRSIKKAKAKAPMIRSRLSFPFPAAHVAARSTVAVSWRLPALH